MNAHFPGTVARRSRSPLTFFVLVFVLAVPFWLVGAVGGPDLLPKLPVVDALIVVCPLLAASILAYRENGTTGVKALLRRGADYRRIPSRAWYAPALLVMPASAVVAYEAMRAVGLPLPTPHVPLLAAPVLFLGFLVGAVSEEVGWSGYAVDALQGRWSALETGLVVGAAGALWHLIALVQIGRAPAWIAWWCLWTAGARVLSVWLYNNTGRSVFAASLFHATMNVSWQLFPNSGSHFDPRVNGLCVAAAAAIVTVVWGPRTLTRGRRRPLSR